VIQRLDRDWLTPAQAAAYMQVHRNTIDRWLRRGFLRAGQAEPGGRVRVSAASIEKMLERNFLNSPAIRE
jgi:excisionase family DNA binding protein